VLQLWEVGYLRKPALPTQPSCWWYYTYRLANHYKVSIRSGQLNFIHIQVWHPCCTQLHGRQAFQSFEEGEIDSNNNNKVKLKGFAGYFFVVNTPPTVVLIHLPC